MGNLGTKCQKGLYEIDSIEGFHKNKNKRQDGDVYCDEYSQRYSLIDSKDLKVMNHQL